MTHPAARDVYPYFSGSENGTFSSVIEIDSSILGRRHALRAYLPPGYGENALKNATGTSQGKANGQFPPIVFGLRF